VSKMLEPMLKSDITATVWALKWCKNCSNMAFHLGDSYLTSCIYIPFTLNCNADFFLNSDLTVS
jgi:hypothetical protein